MIPLKNFGVYTLCVKYEDETGDKREALADFSDSEYAQVEDFDFFRVEVSLWTGGKQIAVDHLNGCVYKDRNEFHTKPCASGYFEQMVSDVTAGKGIDTQVDLWLTWIREAS